MVEAVGCGLRAGFLTVAVGAWNEFSVVSVVALVGVGILIGIGYRFWND
jgi:hypothetical protein